MATRAQILLYFLDEFQRFEDKVERMTASNESRIALTRAHLNDSSSLIVDRRSRTAARPFRSNESFLR
jgi:DNA-binding transcriptional regulator/RsmH inhibitor MraZ